MAVDEKKLEAIVSQQIQLAKSHDKHEREADRSKALDYYLGKMDAYVPVEANRSKVVSRDTADTIGWMLPGIIRVFTASDRMAVAEPVGEEDVQFARQATDGLNYVFWKDNKGYEIIYAATWDALLVGNGVVKTWYDETPVYTTSFHSGLTEDQRAQLLMPGEDGEEPEVLAQSEKPLTLVDPQTNEPIEVTLYDLKIKRKKADGKFVIEAIPPEQFLINEDAICTDEAAFTAHWERKMRSDLIAMGYDRDDVLSIPEAARNETPEEASRRAAMSSYDAADASTELVDYYDGFIRIDVDDDGEAELVRVCFAGDTKLLHWEVWEDENPFDDIPCEPVPHRWVARSVADETMDVQDVKTVLTRQALNNIYASNNPRQAVIGGPVENMDELVNPTFGGTVFAKQGTEIVPLPVPFVANHAFEAMAQMDEVIQRRTGVSRQGMALDPETLQNQSATANQNQKDASYSQIEQIARNMAEWGWSKVFRKLLKLMIKHQGPRSLMMNGKPVQIDPRYWNADMDVTINVGLGTGSRDRDLMMLNNIFGTQAALTERLMLAGFSSEALDMLPKLIRTATKMAESSGIRNPEDFYPDIDGNKLDQMKQQAAQPKTDPKVELEKQKLGFEVEKSKVEMQMDAQKNEQDIVLQREKIAGEMQLKREQMVMEIQLKREQLAAELTLKRELSMQEMEVKREQGFYQADRTAEVGKYKADASSRVSMGGDPG